TALQQIAAIEWLPEWGKERITTMISNRPDWCISRQRTWGVPIPLLIHRQSNALHPDTLTIIDKVADQVAEQGIEAWFDIAIDDLINDGDDYRKLTDVLDVWFDSGVSHYAVLAQHPALQYPADLYLEGSDQHRGWFQTSLLSSVAMHGVAPYKTVLTHGFTVDAKGHKMSKSLGNVIAPDKVMKTLGADVLRLWAASTDYSSEMTVSDEIFKRSADVYRRIRNTARFLLANINDFTLKNALAHNELLALDGWLIDAAYSAQLEIQHAYDKYQFHIALQKIHHFCSITLGGFYLDIIKDRQYTCQVNSCARRSAQTAMYHVLEALVRWIAPILCFTADEIWQYMPERKNESVHLTTWYQSLFSVHTLHNISPTDWQQIILIRDAVNKEIEQQRNANKLGSGLAAEVTLYANEAITKVLKKFADELRFVFITSAANVLPESKKTTRAITTDMVGLAIEVVASQHTKCTRCWHRLANVGSHSMHPELCQRCVTNINGKGEQRYYA
ncbi:MAG: class I tRNA ligase family protein, partial [Gammaproteobacteria bacterium]|nr:class I tRNA ligase family protein [Gammaproteobacteria bacterium]